MRRVSTEHPASPKTNPAHLSDHNAMPGKASSAAAMPTEAEDAVQSPMAQAERQKVASAANNRLLGSRAEVDVSTDSSNIEVAKNETKARKSPKANETPRVSPDPAGANQNTESSTASDTIPEALISAVPSSGADSSSTSGTAPSEVATILPESSEGKTISPQSRDARKPVKRKASAVETASPPNEGDGSSDSTKGEPKRGRLSANDSSTEAPGDDDGGVVLEPKAEPAVTADEAAPADASSKDHDEDVGTGSVEANTAIEAPPAVQTSNGVPPSPSRLGGQSSPSPLASRTRRSSTSPKDSVPKSSSSSTGARSRKKKRKEVGVDEVDDDDLDWETDELELKAMQGHASVRDCLA